MKHNRLAAALVAVAVVVLLAAGGFYFASPWMAVGALKQALHDKDRDRLEELIDFPSVRENLKADFNAMMMKKVNEDPEMKNNPFSGLALAIIPGLVDRMVDAAVNPANLSNLGGRAALDDKAPVEGAKGSPPGKITMAYDGLNRFRILEPIDQGQALGWVMKRKGLFGWRLTRIELPAKLFEQASQPAG